MIDRLLGRAALAASILIIFAGRAEARSFVHGPKLVGSGAAGGAKQGSAVALSANGNTALVGGPTDNSNAGATWVFVRTSGLWSQQGDKLVGTGGDAGSMQGSSVALSGDGNTALVGGPTDASGVGAAWVFTRSNGIWTQQGDKLVSNPIFETGHGRFGWSVALSSDGNVALIGGKLDNSLAGAAWVFTRSGGVWTQQFKLVGSDATGAAQQGTSVALSSDGATALVGGPADNTNLGAAFVFTGSGNSWTQQGAKLFGSGGVASSMQGASVALSSDGNTALVGGPGDNGTTGAVWVFTRSGSTWSPQGGKLVGSGVAGLPKQGTSVALSSDGNTALVGAPADDSTGAVWVFMRSAGTWGQSGNKLSGTGADGSAQQGTAVALSSAGATALVGGAADNSSVGAGWIFTSLCREGDSNGDGTIDVSDVFYLINYLFAGGPSPQPCY